MKLIVLWFAWQINVAHVVGAKNMVQEPCANNASCAEEGDKGLGFVQRKANQEKAMLENDEANEATEAMDLLSVSSQHTDVLLKDGGDMPKNGAEAVSKPSLGEDKVQSQRKPPNPSSQDNLTEDKIADEKEDYNHNEDKLDDEKEACSAGTAEDCKCLRATKKFAEDFEEGVGDEFDAMRKEIGKVPPGGLMELQNNMNSSDQFIEAFDGFKVHLGPVVISEEGLDIKPQMQFGAESNHFNFVAGCGDVQNGIKCEATAEVRYICEITEPVSSIITFLDSIVCHGDKFFAKQRIMRETGSELIKLLAEEIGVDGSGPVSVSGKVTYAQGASMMAGVALGLWEDEEGYKMKGGGVAGFKKEIGGELYVGIHSSGHSAKFKVAAAGGTVEGKFNCQSRKTDLAKVNRVAGAVAVKTAQARKFQPVGYGYGRAPGGLSTPGCAKMYVTWNDCLRECDSDPHCVGFDAEEKYDQHWQQCNIRLDSYRTKPGWHCGVGDGKKQITQGTSSVSNRVVMAKNQFVQVGFGYGRGLGGVTPNSYCKMSMTFGQCKDQCANDPMCTGFDVEQNWIGSYQQCCIRVLQGKYAPAGWLYQPLSSVTVVQGTQRHAGNREVWAKAPFSALSSPHAIYTKHGDTTYYLHVCGNGHASSVNEVRGWCEMFFFEQQDDGSYGIYSRNGHTKYYLKICGLNQATSQHHIGGWCEKLFVEQQSDWSSGIYTTHDGGSSKYYLKICGLSQATSQGHVGGWCEKFFVRAV